MVDRTCLNQEFPVTDEIRTAFSSEVKCVIIAALNFWLMRGCGESGVVLKFSRTVPESRECLSYLLIGSVVSTAAGSGTDATDKMRFAG
jgi:hypothetical protein